MSSPHINPSEEAIPVDFGGRNGGEYAGARRRMLKMGLAMAGGFSFQQLQAATSRKNASTRKPTEPEPQPVPPAPYLGKPRGEFATISGRFIEPEYRLRDDGPFRVMRIDGLAIQEDIVLAVRRPVQGQNAPPPLPGEHFTFRGIEGGAWISPEGQAVLNPTRSSKFVPHFLAVRELPIPPITYAPEQFLERTGWFTGQATNLPEGAVISTPGWTLWMGGLTLWPEDICGKAAEAWGHVAPGPQCGHYLLREPHWSLHRLEDQTSRFVELRGRPRVKNGWWWFEHRGLNLYVDHMTSLSGFRSELAGKDVIIAGKLERKSMPSLDKAVDSGATSDRSSYYVVTEPKLRLLTSQERKIAVPYAGDVTCFYPDGHW